MTSRPRTLGMLRITDHPTLTLSSTTVYGSGLAAGVYILLFPHWYRVTGEGSLDAVAKTSILPHKAHTTSAGEWQRDLGIVLDRPLDLRLAPRQANVPYVLLFEYDLAPLQEDIPTSFPPHASVYLEPWFYTTDKQGRLQAQGPFPWKHFPRKNGPAASRR